MVTHVFREKFQLFGLTSTEAARPGEPRQIGLWRMRLTDRGRPRKGGVISQAITAPSASVRVTGVLPSFINDLMHLTMQDDLSGELSYLVFDLAFGRVVRATPITP